MGACQWKTVATETFFAFKYTCKVSEHESSYGTKGVTFDLIDTCLDVVALPFVVLFTIASGGTVPPDVFSWGLAIYTVLGCAGAPWLAVQTFTTTTLSVGEFQWVYKETVAGMDLNPTCYRQGKTEELDISRDGDKIILITGLTRFEVGRQNVGALSNKELNWVVDSVQTYQRQIAAI